MATAPTSLPVSSSSSIASTVKEQCSLCILGDGSVGKSSMIAAFKTDGFTPVYKQTIGVDFFEKQLRIRNKVSISLRIWDVGGQSINSKNLHTYLASSDVVFLVYDVTNTESYANLDDWLQKVVLLCSPCLSISSKLNHLNKLNFILNSIDKGVCTTTNTKFRISLCKQDRHAAK